MIKFQEKVECYQLQFCIILDYWSKNYIKRFFPSRGIEFHFAIIDKSCSLYMKMTKVLKSDITLYKYENLNVSEHYETKMTKVLQAWFDF